MGQQADITVYDGATTPVQHTLTADGIERLSDGTTIARWKEVLAGVPDYAQVRYSQTKKRLPSGVFILVEKVEVPVMESIAGQNAAGYTAPPKVAYIDTWECVGKFHERSVVYGRRLARQLGLNIAGGVTASVSPVTTGPGPELADRLVQVS